MKKGLLLSLALCFLAVSGYAADWYKLTAGGGVANVLADWTSDPAGIVVDPPANFANVADIWHVSGPMSLSGDWTLPGDIVIEALGTLTCGAQNIYLSGDFTNNGIFNPGTGALAMEGAGAQAINGVTTFYSFGVTGTGTTSVNANITIDNALITVASGTLDMTTFQLLGAFTATHDGTLQTQNTTNPAIPSGKTWGGTVNFNRANGGQFVPSGFYTNLAFNNTSGTQTATGNISVSTTISTTAGGTLNMATFQLVGAFVPTNDGTIQTQNTTNPAITPSRTWGGTVQYNSATGGQFLPTGTFNNLIFNNTSGTQTVTGTITVNGTLETTAGGTVTLTFYQLLGNPSTVTNNGTIRTQNTTNPAIPSGETWGGTVQFDAATGAQEFPAGTYNNLTFSNTSGTQTAQGNVTVNGNFTTTAGGTVDMATFQLLGAFTAANSGTLQTQSTSSPAIPASKTWGGTVQYNATTGGQFIPVGTYNNLTFSNTSGTTTATGILTVNTNFTTTAGGTVNMSTFQLLGAFTAANSGTLQTSTTSNPAIPAGRTWGGLVEYNNAASGQTIAAGDYNNINSNGGGGARTFGGTLNVAGDMNITTTNGAMTTGILNIAGDFTMNVTAATITLGGALNVDGNLTLAQTASATSNVFNPAGFQINLGGDYTVSTTMATVTLVNIGTPFTMVLDGTGAQNLSKSAGGSLLINLYHLQNSNTGGTVTISNSTRLTGTLTNDLGATLSPGSNSIEVRGSWVNNGTFTAGTSTVTFASTTTGNTIAGNLTGANEFNNLIFNGAGGEWTFSNAAETADDVTITNGTVIAPAATFSIGGDLSKAGGGTFTHNSGTVAFNGGAAQSILSTPFTFHNLHIVNTTATVTAAVALTVNNTLTTDASTNLNMGTNQLLGAFTAANSGTLQTQNALNPPIPNGNTWGGTVLYNTGTGTQNISSGTYNNLTITGTTATKTFLGATDVTGTLAFTTTTGVATLGGVLNVNNISLTSTGASVFNVSGSNHQINLSGNWTQSSGGANNPFNRQTGTVVLNGTGAQVLSTSGGTSVPHFHNLTVNNVTTPLALANNIDVAGTLSVSANATVNPAAAVQINSGGATGTISGSGKINVTRTAATPDYSTQYRFTTNTLSAMTVDYNAAGAQNVNSNTYGTLITSGSGTKSAQGNLTINDALNVGATTTLDMGATARLISGTAPVYTVDGTLSTSVPTATSALPIPSGITWGGTVTYGALTGVQTVMEGTYNNLTLSNTSGINTTSGAITTNGTLTLGKVSLGANNLVLGTAATISGASASNYVVATGAGRLRKMLTANGTFAYPVGDASNYSPVSIDMAGAGYAAAYTEANVTATKHPNNTSTTNFLNRYWSVNTSGITTPSYTATATYVGGDIAGTEGLISAASYAGSLPWIKYGVAGTNSVVATAVTTASTDISGVTNAAPTVTVTPTTATTCSGVAVLLTASGTGDPTLTYSWAGAGLSATTGTTVNATPTTVVHGSTEVYTLTVTDGNGITNTVTATVTVNIAPTAVSANAAPNPVCNNSNLTLTGAASNATSYSWAGPNSYSNTNLNPAAFAAVTASAGIYTLSAINACGTTTATTTAVTVTPTPSIDGAMIICIGGAPGTLTSDAPGGTWISSHPANATINLTTGEITGVLSGTSNITYTSPATCVNVAQATVDPLPAVNGLAILCVSNVTTFTSDVPGGTWMSSDTLIARVDTFSGVVTGIGAGNVAISYTTPIGCINSADLTVNAAVANIGSYGPDIYGVCFGDTVTLTNATPGGTWESSNPTVATIDVNTGFVDGLVVGIISMTYRISAGCYNTIPFATKALPAANTGTMVVCEGSTTILSNPSGGGTWTSSNPAVGTVYPFTGAVTGVGVAGGTTTITYNWYNQCNAYSTVTVNPRPTVITGSPTVCAGFTSALSSTPGGGVWATTHTVVATVDAGTGVMTGVVGGLTSVSYTLATGCRRITNVTVNNPPAAITSGSFGQLICPGGTTNLSSTSSGHIWSSEDGGIATVSGSGVVTGVSPGTVNIVYTHSITACPRSTVVTVTTLPASITGPTTICMGSNPALANATPGGTWASSDWSNATINMSTGIVNPVSTGTSNITYKIAGNGCHAISEVTVNSTIASITGTTTVCVGQTTDLNNADGGGVWSSSNPAVGTVDAGTGVVTAIGTGTTTITYMLTAGCFKTATVTVNNPPSAITGTTTVCVGTTTALANASPGGTWSSSTPAQATIGVTSGIATAVGAGNPTITYRTGGAGCFATQALTVNAAMAAIGGTASVCVGSNTTLTHADGGGTWTSSNMAVGTVGSSSGQVTGLMAGTTIISYTVANGCYQQRIVTVNAIPIVSGTATICNGSATTLSSSLSGGAWTSSNLAVGTINSTTRIVTGLSAGTTIITHTVAGCEGTMEMTVNVVPTAITGTLMTCIGGTTTLGSTPGSGEWTSSAAGVATIGSATGIATGVGNGTTNISYTLATGCRATAVLTVDNVPAAITGTLEVCAGSTTALASATPGGVWSSVTGAVATISVGGLVTAVAPGTSMISYEFGTGCYQTAIVTVNPAAGANTGTAVVCVGLTTDLDNATGGGTWTSANTSLATVGSADGIVTGVGAGIVDITYSLNSSCFSITTVTVNAAPAPITGTAEVCIGLNTTLSSIDGGGTWSSSNLAIGTVGSSTGEVTGISAGVITITYSLGGSCFSTVSFTVKALPAAISGTQTVCEGSTTMFSNGSGGGTWTSDAPATASVYYASGLVTGEVAGNTTITYNWYNGCYAVRTVTVNPLPSVIGGTTTICAGNSSTLTSAPGSGTWTSSNEAVATIGSATGLVNAITSGLSTISYTLATGCRRTATVSVGALPAAISGTLLVCPGGTSALSSSAGHVWSSEDDDFATVSVGGLVTGVAPGTVDIIYTHSLTACPRSVEVTVTALPASITGPTTICLGSTGATLACATGGGTWSSSDWTNVTINSATGVLTPVSTGTSNITYRIAGNGCYSTTTVTVNAALAAITGTKTVCVGATTTLNHVVGGGTWASSDVSNGTIDAGSGIVAGIDPGTTTITYTSVPGCYTTTDVTVTALPAAITGEATVCVGTSTALASATSGGTWTSSNTGQATIGSATGIANGVGAGNPTVTYTINGAGCFVTRELTVNAALAAIGGTASVCAGSTTTLTHAVGGGTWTSANLSRATVGSSSGEVTGLSAGTVIISYSVAGGCYQQITVTVNAIPVISGTASTCTGSSTVLTSTISGGAWTSSTPAVGTINTVNRIVYGISEGTTTITHTTASGCVGVREVTVNPVPAAITGTGSTCVGGNTTLASITGGGSWTSSNGAVASIGTGTGIVTGIGSGTTRISYTLATGCRSTTVVTVASVPTAITGTLAVCLGSTSVLASTPSGGTWLSTNTSVATVGSSTGIVTGLLAGNTTISYTYSSGCVSTAVVTVNAALTSNTGTALVCAGQTVTLSNVTGGGTWSSSNTSQATVGVATGIVTGVSAGTSNITYRTTGGCYSITEVTVNAAVAANTGTASVCIGATTDLDNADGGGAWSSSNPARATVDAGTGVVQGISSGTVVITYTLSAGCFKTTTVNVLALPAAIGGTAVVCEGSTTTVTNGSGGGTWTSSTPSVATVYYANGYVTGVSAGNTTITYNWHNGCKATRVLTVNERPSAITGTTTVCAGSNTTLSSAPGTGTWTSSAVGVATIGSATGIVTGVNSGYTNISYTLPTGCRRIQAVTVNVRPTAITGTLTICPGGTSDLNASSGSTWTTADADIATVHSGTGLVTGVGVGAVNITFSHANGCYRIANVTVNALPDAITGANALCIAATTTYTNTSGGGTWSSSHPARASINSGSGLATGVAAGTANITYKVTGNGCLSTKQITVNALPANIGGAATVAVAASTTLTNGTGGGTWSSANESFATVGSTTGMVTGVAPGATTISYIITATGCYKTKAMTVTASKPGETVTEVEENNNTSFVIFPNPTSGTFTLNTTATGKLTVYTIDGRTIQEYEISRPEMTMSLPYDLSAGVYICRFAGTDGTTQVVRLVYNP